MYFIVVVFCSSLVVHFARAEEISFVSAGGWGRKHPLSSAGRFVSFSALHTTIEVHKTSKHLAHIDSYKYDTSEKHSSFSPCIVSLDAATVGPPVLSIRVNICV
jgi:hypothetical protein